jgi:hypothetical protein
VDTFIVHKNVWAVTATIRVRALYVNDWREGGGQCSVLFGMNQSYIYTAHNNQNKKDETSTLSQLTIQSIRTEPEADEANNKP